MRRVFHHPVIILNLLCLISPSSLQLEGLEQLAKRSPLIGELNEILENEIQRTSVRIQSMRNIMRDLDEFAKYQYPGDSNDTLVKKKLLDPGRMKDSVQAFMVVSRLYKIIEDIDGYFLGENNGNAWDWPYQMFNNLQEKKVVPGEEEIGELRKSFLSQLLVYNIKPQDALSIAKEKSRGPKPLEVTYKDIFHIGFLAYTGKRYSVALDYFYKALDMADMSNENDEGILEFVPNVLDHAAFSAYMLGNLEEAIYLTNLFKEFGIDQERANDNIKFYLEELGESATNTTRSTKSQSTNGVKVETSNLKYPDGSPDPDNYVIEDDEIVKNLCRGVESALPDFKLTCISKPIVPFDDTMSPVIHIERISVEPEILRVYNIISRSEAAYLEEMAEPKLYRSTVQIRGGTTTSGFRAAQTAWLSALKDRIVMRIEERLSKVFGLSMDESEDMQVVKYEIGGFYGPHLDSARGPNIATNAEQSERLATILIYLNNVDFGGATVFPRLDMKVEPVARSALIWYNLKKNGFADPLTLHMSCPVFMGTKWIATKWPRDKPNAFTRPCGLTERE